MYDFYTKTYLGTSISEEDFPQLAARAGEVLQRYCRCYQVSGDETMRRMAVCAMAEVLDYYQAAQNGTGGLRYASVGTVSVSGKGIYSQLDISPAAQESELYRAACRYLEIYRGVSA